MQAVASVLPAFDGLARQRAVTPVANPSSSSRVCGTCPVLRRPAVHVVVDVLDSHAHHTQRLATWLWRQRR